jgi:hypothetical protein
MRYYQATVTVEGWAMRTARKLSPVGSAILMLGLLLIAVAFAVPAYAQAGHLAGPPAVSWTFWVNLAFGVLLAVVGAYVKGQNGRLEKLENNYAALHQMVLRDYHSKHDLADILAEIKSSVKALHHRFDAILDAGKRNG